MNRLTISPHDAGPLTRGHTHDDVDYEMDTSLIVTDGGLVFSGDAAGWFRALDQETGEVLWETELGAQVTGYPATFAVDGKQYVAVSTGRSLTTLSLMRLVDDEFRAGVETDLYVFALPD